MDTKTKLENYWFYQKLIPCNNDELTRLEQIAAFPMTNETAAKFAAYQADVEADIVRYLGLMEAIETAISNIPNEHHRVILWLKYVEGMTWRELAGTLKFDYTYVQKIAANVISGLKISPS